jgi:hypothetical protein
MSARGHSGSLDGLLDVGVPIERRSPLVAEALLTEARFSQQMCSHSQMAVIREQVP